MAHIVNYKQESAEMWNWLRRQISAIKNQIQKLFKPRHTWADIDHIANNVLLHYFQNWGQTLLKRIQTLNEVVKFCGIQAEFHQNPESIGWEGKSEKECQRAIEFRTELDKCFPRGQFELEHKAIKRLIEYYVEVKE